MTMEEISEKVAAHEATLTQMNERLGHIRILASKWRQNRLLPQQCLCDL
jgi:uncharacterized coiled-coil protein SlyX